MMTEECPNCRQITNTSFSRLVKDSCGHTKCRICLLHEEQGCKVCHDQHRIQTIGNFDCPTSSEIMVLNTDAGIKSSIVSEETIFPLELVINKDSKTKTTHYELLSIDHMGNSESHHEESIASNNNESRTMYECSPTDDHCDNVPNAIYIPQIEPCSTITNLQTHIHNNSNLEAPSDLTCSIAAEEEAETCDMKIKSGLQISDKTKCLKSKHLKQPDRSHISIVPGIPERYKCNACNKIFRNKKGKCYHDACITGVRPYKCTLCDRSFVKRSHFEYHERVHTGYKPYKCDLCDKAFPQRNKLNRHMYSHSNEKQFACPKCNKAYSKRDDLKNHLNSHNSTTTYTCKTCNKSFQLLTNLKRHMRTHINERPHTCDQCNKSFKDRSLLIRHRRTHGKDRPFSCAHCNRVFLSKSELRRHLMVHSDEKPYSCMYCETVFRRKDNLNRHIRHHHSENTNLDNKSQPMALNPNKKVMKMKQIRNIKEKQKPKKGQRTTSTTLAKSPTKVSVLYISSRDQINSRLDSMGNITPVIRTTSEVSNAVPVINGPINIRKMEDKTDSRKKTFTYIEPIPLAEAVVINRRIEEKLYPQSTSNHNYFFRNHSTRPDRQSLISPAMRPNCGTRNNFANKPLYFENLPSESSTSLHTNFNCNDREQTVQDSITCVTTNVCKNNDAEGESTKDNENPINNDNQIVLEVINTNECNYAEPKQDCSNVFVKQDQSNFVSTIKKHTPELSNYEEQAYVNNRLETERNTSLPKSNNSPDCKKQINMHWRRRTAEILKPYTE